MSVPMASSPDASGHLSCAQRNRFLLRHLLTFMHGDAQSIQRLLPMNSMLLFSDNISVHMDAAKVLCDECLGLCMAPDADAAQLCEISCSTRS